MSTTHPRAADTSAVGSDSDGEGETDLLVEVQDEGGKLWRVFEGDPTVDATTQQIVVTTPRDLTPSDIPRPPTPIGIRAPEGSAPSCSRIHADLCHAPRSVLSVCSYSPMRLQSASLFLIWHSSFLIWS